MFLPRLPSVGLEAIVVCIAVAINVVSGQQAGQKPHIIMHLIDDYGWANAGWHRQADFREVQTPVMNDLVKNGIELDRAYSFQYCSPSRSSLQSGRLPTHVNTENLGTQAWNPKDPVSGFAGIPRNMTGMAVHMKAGGYATHQVGKWDAGMATHDHTPQGRGYDSSLGYFCHANDYWYFLRTICLYKYTTKHSESKAPLTLSTVCIIFSIFIAKCFEKGERLSLQHITRLVPRPSMCA